VQEVVACAARLDAQVGALALTLEEQQTDFEHKIEQLTTLVRVRSPLTRYPAYSEERRLKRKSSWSALQ